MRAGTSAPALINLAFLAASSAAGADFGQRAVVAATTKQCVLPQIELTQRRSHLTKSLVHRRNLATKVPLRLCQFRIKRLISRQRLMNFSASSTVTSEMPPLNTSKVFIPA